MGEVRINSEKKQRMLFAAVMLAVLLAGHLVSGGRFLGFANIKTIVAHSIFYAFVSWGMMFIFTTGVVDLSVGANVILAANIGAVCAMDYGMGYVGLVIMTVLSAVILEFLSVLCSVQLKIPSWISGLGMALIYEAVLNIYANERAKTAGTNVIMLKDYRALGQVAVMILFLLVGFAAVYILFNRTTIGFNITAVGGNGGVAAAMGINRKKTIIMGAIIGGIFIGLGALLQESYVGKFTSVTGLSSLNSIFRSLAIVLLGQSFAGFISLPTGILICSILVMGLFNFLTMIGIPSGTGQEMCLGALVILCGIISHWKSKGVEK